MNLDWYRSKVRSADFYTISKRLDEFYRRDFSCMSTIMKDLFPRSWDRRIQRDIPIVEAIAKETATFYRRPCSRSWKLTTGDPLSENSQTALTKIYSALKMSRVFKDLHEMAVIQRTVIGVLVPKSNSVDNAYMVKLFNPWQCEVDPDPMDSSVNAVREFRFSVPLTATHDNVTFGKMVINKDRAVWRTTKGEEAGIYSKDKSMPFEDYPVFVCRMGPPAPGDFFCSLPTDIYDASIALSIAYSDADHVARFQSHGQRVLTNASLRQVQEMEFGPDTVIGLDDDQELEVVSNQTNIADYLSSTEAFLRQVVVHNHLNPSQFMKGNLTGLSKQMELFDREAIRQDHKIALQDCENSFYRALRSVLNHNIKAAAWPRALAEVSYNEADFPADPLAVAQANRFSYEDGTNSPISTVARQHNISDEQAEKIVLKNLEQYKAVKDAMKESGVK